MLLPDTTECLHQSAERVTLYFELSPTLTWFQGHFPEQPILPGVAQLHWVEHFAREWLALSGLFSGLQTIKFLHPVKPGQGLLLDLIWSAAKNQLRFTYRLASARPDPAEQASHTMESAAADPSPTTVVSSGKINFLDPNPIEQAPHEQL